MRDTSLIGFIERIPKRLESPREHKPPTRSNPSRGKKEDSFSGGTKPLKHQNKA
jgi:hypothetical protein